MKLCTDLSYSKEASEYATQLKRVEKQNLLKEQAVSVYRTFVPFSKMYSTSTYTEFLRTLRTYRKNINL